MFQLPMSSTSRSLPLRTDSLNSSKAAVFTQIDEELRDVRRVHSQGQEEDLRMALSQTISRVQELSSMLKEAFKVQADLQTELTLAKSNLQLALANNEMLEDALKRDGPGHSKDVGWRRWSAKEQRERELAADSRRQSLDSIASVDAIAPSPIPPSPLPSAAPSAVPGPEGRFFKFRFGATSSPVVGSPRLPAGNMSPIPNGNPQATAHLTSASLPSLVPARDKDKELEDMAALLDRERKAHKAAQSAKEALEAELESLSQALFEEANKMVAAERMKRAETAEELKEAQAEKEALRSALRLVEGQRTASHSRENSMSPEFSFNRPSAHTHKRSSSSAIAIKSLPPSEPSSPRSMQRISIDLPSTRAPVPPPLSLPQVGLATEKESEPSPAEDIPEGSTLAPSKLTELSNSPSPSASPTPSAAQYAYRSARPPISYFDSEESPWADARSTTPVTAAF